MKLQDPRAQTDANSRLKHFRLDMLEQLRLERSTVVAQINKLNDLLISTAERVVSETDPELTKKFKTRECIRWNDWVN